jgi:hypothetical protein
VWISHGIEHFARSAESAEFIWLLQSTARSWFPVWLQISQTAMSGEDWSECFQNLPTAAPDCFDVNHIVSVRHLANLARSGSTFADIGPRFGRFVLPCGNGESGGAVDEFGRH